METETRPLLPLMLSFNGGYVDTVGFLALQGLFTAHVTGNFVTLGAAAVFGTSGAFAKLLALPVFCAIVALTRVIGYVLDRRHWRVLSIFLFAKLVLLIVAAILAIRLGPFSDGDGWPALVTGMTMVAAMAIQNAVHRIYLGATPPTTLMTGTTTQIMIDLADLCLAAAASERQARSARLKRMASNVAIFAAGRASAALAYSLVQVWSFCIPPFVALCTFLLRLSQQKQP